MRVPLLPIHLLNHLSISTISSKSSTWFEVDDLDEMVEMEMVQQMNGEEWHTPDAQRRCWKTEQPCVTQNCAILSLSNEDFGK